MKELGQKISRLSEDILVEFELRREGFRRDKQLERDLKPVRPFVFKLRSEVLIGILAGTTLVGGTIWLASHLIHRKKN